MSASEWAAIEQETPCQDVSTLEDLWHKLDAQIRQTHGNLDKLIEAKIRVERELSRNEVTTAPAREPVTLEQREHFTEVRKEAFRRYFEDALDRVPVELWANYRESGQEASHVARG
jgi:hypothetical protein